jgi:hypothetical protein
LLCLAHGSAVTAPVTVRSGASLHAAGTSVEGPLRAGGAATVEVYGSTVVGPVALRDGTTQVAVIGNHVTGSVSLDRNVTGDTPIVVSANTVVGPLACSGNRPPPVNNGQPNTVSGPRSGQCRDL